MQTLVEQEVYEHLAAHRTEDRGLMDQTYVLGKGIVHEAAARMRKEFHIHSDGPIIELDAASAIAQTVGALAPADREYASMALEEYYLNILAPVIACTRTDAGPWRRRAAATADVARVVQKAIETWVETVALWESVDL